jgi:hypothetical protein
MQEVYPEKIIGSTASGRSGGEALPGGSGQGGLESGLLGGRILWMARRISLVVPLFSDSRRYINRLPLQRRQWISLKNQTDPDFELVLADNSSYDDVVGLAREYFPDAVAIRHEVPKNTTGARLAGVGKASCPHVVTLDSDCIVWPKFIERWKIFVSFCSREVGVGGFYWYNGIIVSGPEWIVGEKPSERIDYAGLEVFTRGHLPGGRAGYPMPESMTEEDKAEPWSEPFQWGGGFFYSNACFPKEVYLQIGAPDAGLTGYGHDDSLFGMTLKRFGPAVRYVRGVPVLHQCHRDPKGKDASHREDCTAQVEHIKIIDCRRKILGGCGSLEELQRRLDNPKDA